MISQVDICNLALTHIGKASISSLDEASEPARKCKLIYSISRDAVLRASTWKFATKVEALAEISGETLLGWDYLYKEPSTCLFVRKIYNEATVGLPDPQEFKQLLSPLTSQKAIAAKIEQAYAEFTNRVTDPNLYDTSFIKALSYLLASELAQPLTGDLAMGKRMLDVYSVMIDEAQLTNGSEGFVKQQRTSSYLDAR